MEGRRRVIKRKILYVVDAIANYSGLDRVVIEKLNWLVENSQFEVFLLTFNQGTLPFSFSLHRQINHVDLGIMTYRAFRYSGLKRLLYRYKIQRLLRRGIRQYIHEISPDIVISCQRQFVTDVECSRGEIPFLFECHSGYSGGNIEGESLWQHIQEKWGDRSVRKANGVVTLTHGDAEKWRRVNPNVEVIPNIVHLNDTGRFCDCSEKIVIFVGRYAVQKDIGSLLQIWKIVHSRHSDWQLHLYGGYGNESGKWQKRIERMNANIFTFDATSNIFAKYISSSILVLTSLHEPFGLVLPEAMSCGVPVVSFDCPYGPADIITDGVDGFLIKNRNIDDFANCLCRLIEDKDLRVQIGKAGIVSSQRYASDIIMPRWIRLYEKMMS